VDTAAAYAALYTLAPFLPGDGTIYLVRPVGPVERDWAHTGGPAWCSPCAVIRRAVAQVSPACAETIGIITLAVARLPLAIKASPVRPARHRMPEAAPGGERGPTPRAGAWRAGVAAPTRAVRFTYGKQCIHGAYDGCSPPA